MSEDPERKFEGEAVIGFVVFIFFGAIVCAPEQTNIPAFCGWMFYTALYMWFLTWTFIIR